MIIWPNHETVDVAVREWATVRGSDDRRVLRVGYFGSYASGNWGVGSDLDVIVFVSEASTPFERRAAGWDTSELPVPVDLLVYTPEEWTRMRRDGSRFAATVEDQAVWVYDAGSEV